MHTCNLTQEIASVTEVWQMTEAKEPALRKWCEEPCLAYVVLEQEGSGFLAWYELKVSEAEDSQERCLRFCA